MPSKGSKKKILIIDDEGAFCRLLKLNLEATGEYEVRSATKAVIGCLVARDFQPDLIFLDIIMPDMRGDQVVEQLMSNLKTQNIPLVIISGTDPHKMGGVNFDVLNRYPVLIKPTSTEEIISCIEENLSKFHKRKTG